MKTLDESIEILCGAYKRKAPQEYIDKLKTYLVHDLKLNLETIEILCRRLPEVVKSFPTRVDINKVLEEIKKNKHKYKPSIAAPKSAVHEKTKGELLGLPTSIESLCIMIDEGRTERGFQWACKSHGITEEQIWKIYESRAEGKLHPFVLEYKTRKGLKHENNNK